MVTGRPDMDCYTLHLDAFKSLYGDRYVALTQCRHIIPFSVNSFNEERDETFGFNVCIVVMLSMFMIADRGASSKGQHSSGAS